ncbi:hypothetical protein Purlil1_997 [Purpureocillium lilacinum]|uniref:Uncharacterized protein n=1 Tax=Purpureocillium lilacinum TaxID=33203 RepID=A0ABR0CE45_PURLI|nr:hypothetical protein Purlil1_997 [Purpureocillium lilacinum]
MHRMKRDQRARRCTCRDKPPPGEPPPAIFSRRSTAPSRDAPVLRRDDGPQTPPRLCHYMLPSKVASPTTHLRHCLAYYATTRSPASGYFCPAAAGRPVISLRPAAHWTLVVARHCANMAAAETSTADQRCEPPPALAVPRELHVGHLHHPSPAAGGGSALTGAYPSSPYHPGPRLNQCQAKAVEAASGCVQVPPAVAAQESEVAVPSRRVELSPAVCLVLRATLHAGFRPETAPPTTASPDHTPSSCLVGRQAARESRTGGRPTTGRSPHELHMLRAMARFDVFENANRRDGHDIVCVWHRP